jgi:hypothetical protein
VVDSSASQAVDTTSRTVTADDSVDKATSYRNEIAEFCAAIRTGSPVRCGPEKAMKSAVAVLVGNSSADHKRD